MIIGLRKINIRHHYLTEFWVDMFKICLTKISYCRSWKQIWNEVENKCYFKKLCTLCQYLGFWLQIVKGSCVYRKSNDGCLPMEMNDSDNTRYFFRYFFKEKCMKWLRLLETWLWTYQGGSYCPLGFQIAILSKGNRNLYRPVQSIFVPTLMGCSQPDWRTILTTGGIATVGHILYGFLFHFLCIGVNFRQL